MSIQLLMSPLLAALCFAAPLLYWGAPEIAHSQIPTQIHKDELAMRAYMIEISDNLGVTCTHCHNQRDFTDSSKRAYQVAKDHMRIVDLLYKKGFNEHLKVDCRMCHRGEAKPNLNLKLHELAPPKPAEAAAEKKPEVK